MTETRPPCRQLDTVPFPHQDFARNALDHFPVTARSWRVGPPEDFRWGWSEVHIDEAMQRDGSRLFAVRRGAWTANRDGEWEYEPIPSSRDDDYLLRCRFADWETAFLLAQRMADEQARQLVRSSHG